jgi:hypothetical protein
MSVFTDGKNRLWGVQIDIATVKRVRALCGVDLLDLAGGLPPLHERLATDLVLAVDVLYAVCQPQAAAAGIDATQFGGMMAGSRAAEAFAAFWESLADFFQGLRPTHEALARALGTWLAAVRAVETEAVNAPPTEQTPRGDESTNLPASSVSTPAV